MRYQLSSSKTQIIALISTVVFGLTYLKIIVGLGIINPMELPEILQILFLAGGIVVGAYTYGVVAFTIQLFGKKPSTDTCPNNPQIKCSVNREIAPDLCITCPQEGVYHLEAP